MDIPHRRDRAKIGARGLAQLKAGGARHDVEEVEHGKGLAAAQRQRRPIEIALLNFTIRDEMGGTETLPSLRRMVLFGPYLGNGRPFVRQIILSSKPVFCEIWVGGRYSRAAIT